ncbi:MAG: glycosyltransferase family 4 protein [Thermoguttaceae bacterium]
MMVTGLYDVQTAGNQSLKNTLVWLARAGASIDLFSMWPRGYPTLQDPSIFGPNVRIHRLPRWLNRAFNLGKLVKDSLGRWQAKARRTGQDPDQPEGYYAEYNWFGRLTHIGFMFLVCLPVQLLRAGWFSMRLKPDLLYGLNCQGALTASLLGRVLHIPVVTRFHGVTMPPEAVPRWRDRLWNLDELAGLRAPSQAIIVTNDGTRGGETLRRLGVDPAKVHFWMNGFDAEDLSYPEGWDPAAFKASLGLEGKRVLLMVSRLAGWKRVDRGIACVADLVHRYGRGDVSLLIAGEGAKRGELEALARRLGVEQSVRFLGAVAHREVYKYYTIADVFLSLYDVSNLGNPLIEAMYFGRPIVTIDDGSTRGLLADQASALLVDPARLSEELPRCVLSLLDDGALRARLGRGARAAFESNVLSWQQRMETEHRLLRRIAWAGSCAD